MENSVNKGIKSARDEILLMVNTRKISDLYSRISMHIK